MAMTTLALSSLGMESTRQRRQAEQILANASVPASLQRMPALQPMRPSKRTTSYHNSFQTACSPANDNPPSYDTAARQRIPLRQPGYGKEVLPGYSCTVAAGAKVLLQLESISPLHGASESEWREVYVLVRGTLLSFHRAKDSGPGKLLRNYTLQHAEVGMSPDVQHTVLVPQTRLANLIPSSARRKTWQKDPSLFRPVRQTILRLRLETDQLLLADSSEEQIHSLIYAISAAIDISHAIDERSIPRQCTVPRRRRRNRVGHHGDLNDPALLAEQERILRDMYPAFAEQSSESRTDLERAFLEHTAPNTADGLPTDPLQTSSREEDELDLAVIREDFAAPSAPPPTQSDSSATRPPMTRHTTSSSVVSALSTDMLYATSPINFDESGKWQPPHTRTPQQVQRYVRRCMPVLLADAVRASDVLICHGRRVKINWRMELLEEWELQPPSYKSHGFDNGLGLERTWSCSQNSATGSNAPDNAETSRSELGVEGEDQITRAESGLAALHVSKVAAVSTLDKGSPCETAVPKQQLNRHPGAEIHGVVFCF